MFVTFEGIDGCGKSTQVALAYKNLVEKNMPCILTREPGGTLISEKIREVLLSTENKAMCNPCEVLLYLAARAQHVAEKIVPALENGSIVLCDRFMEATFAYQGYGRDVSLDLLTNVNSYATGNLVPDLTFIFDIDVATSVERLKKTNKIPDRLEGSGNDFFQKVRTGYLTLAKKDPTRIVVLSGLLPVAELSMLIFGKIVKRFSEN